MTRRIYGLETEYGVSCSTPGQRRPSPEEVARTLFRSVVAWGRSSNVFLRNGSRLYLDVGSHPEYATAECDDLLQLLAHDQAGERIVDELGVQAAERMREESAAEAEIYLFKNNTDSHGNSYGCHENYLVARTSGFPEVAQVLIPFLVSRQLIAGAGKLLPGGQFVVSQRAAHMWDEVSSATTRMRPMINTRDEPHADPSRFRRLHVIVGDSNLAEPTTLLKVGSTELVLRLIESGAALRDFTLENPTRAVRELSRDPFGRAAVPLANGRSITGLELQQAYLQAVTELVERTGPPGPQLERVLGLWRKVLTALEARDTGGLEREIDWVIKQRLLHRYADRAGLGLDDPRIAQLDLAYHDLRPGRGLYALLRERGAVDTIVDEAAVERARRTPPQTTRARLRGEFVSAAQDAGADYTVDWTTFKVNEPPARSWHTPNPVTGAALYAPVLCTDPFAAADERVDALLEALRPPTRRTPA
ncbi:Pup--protein ligase [Naumannella sp. ID2617S]|nr:Pup--protein ligase [Naumannella sp. ID2617S]